MTTKEKNTIRNFANILWQDVMVFNELNVKYPDENYQRDFDRALAKYQGIEELMKELKIEY